MENLDKLGFCNWFREQITTEIEVDQKIARVIAVNKDSCTISTGHGEIFAELSGNMLFNAKSSLDLPTVGDWVFAKFYDENSHAIINEIINRKTILKRKSAGKSSDFQLIAANIDTAFILQPIHDINQSRLERYLAMIHESKITPIILLSKCDLLPQAEIDSILENLKNTYPQDIFFYFSNQDKTNLDKIKELLIENKTYCLLGSSGVGKTSLLNSLLGNNEFKTSPISLKNNKGKHTTTSRELIILENEAMLIDTPGMRELGNMQINSGIEETFQSITDLTNQCKFRNCSHEKEKGCAIISAVEEGSLTKQQHKNYLKMKRESEMNEMSYHAKRKKDKALGKLYKSAQKRKYR